VGLTGIEILDQSFQPIMLTPGMLSFTTSITLVDLASQLLPTIEWHPELSQALHSAIARLNIAQASLQDVRQPGLFGGVAGGPHGPHGQGGTNADQMAQLNQMMDQAVGGLQEVVQMVLADGLRRLCDGENQTTDPSHMFLMPFSPLGVSGGSCSSLNIDLGQATPVQGLKVWNFNMSLDDSYRGLRRIRVIMDGVLWTPNQAAQAAAGQQSPPTPSGSQQAAQAAAADGCFLLRKAPGNCVIEYGQVMPLNKVIAQPSSSQTPVQSSSVGSSTSVGGAGGGGGGSGVGCAGGGQKEK
jgi:hypothetical protein